MRKALRVYHRKRDFQKTAEPKGILRNKEKGNLIFVVQEHHASHLHYDFRLELDGVLKSWAVPKGPSLNPQDKRLAIEVEDHPLEYASFHGTIPKGEYGAGEVFIWDKGTWVGVGDPRFGLKKGKLEFTLKGKKLKGNFVLIRLANIKSSKPNWLLMKKADEEVDAHFELRPKVLEVSDKTATSQKTNEKDSWPGFISPQLATLVETPPESSKWMHEIKFDGYRLQVHFRQGKVKLFTRGGHDWSDQFPSLTRAFSSFKAKSAILDGEAVVMDEGGRSSFGALQNALSLKDYRNMRIYLFDLLYLNGEDLRSQSLKRRKELLLKLLAKSQPPIFYTDDIKGHGAQFFQTACQYQLEGIISKDRESSYFSGRSRTWQKSKCERRQEFVIGGFTTGHGDRASGFGALLLGVYDQVKGEKLFRYVGRVGSGFNYKTLGEITKKLANLEIDSSPFQINSPKEKNIHWVSPKLLAEINFSEWTADKILRTPVFVGLRSDKSTEEIVIEKASTLFYRESITLSHPEKILFPVEKITKQMIADYYDGVAPFMLPLIKDRPLSLVRCPNGVGKKCFYQKHPESGGVPKELKSFKVREKLDTTIYMALDTVSGLQQLVQMNAFEIHTWNCHYQTLMHPNQIVMDFDPDPSVSFKTVVEACLEMKKILTKLKLKSFVKVSGGKGIHIHIPIEPIYTWDEIKAFSKALADEMVSRRPKEFTATMSKGSRSGKIFLDYLRNDYGATAVSPYAIRARGGQKLSAVALPVEWRELPKLKSSDQFTLKKALLKIKKRKSDPWKDYLSIKQKIILFQKRRVA
ncbi:MAG: DNA ligase D [Bdellovibrio sp.]|nr:DNA ligase D [Bdellovibrio sp.]